MNKHFTAMSRVLIAALFFGLFTLAESAPSEAAGPPGAILYVVQYGDTLESIAAKFGVPVEAILEANGWGAPNKYFPVGAQMHVPYGDGGAPYTNGYGYTNASVYIVQYGDTLFSIARHHGVSVYTLMRLNNLYNPNFIYAGMRLLVPHAIYPPLYNTYIVHFGDTLSGIAVRFGTTVYALMIANNIPNPNLIFAGMRLVIPGSHGYPPPSYPPPSVATPGPTSTPMSGTTASVSLQNIAYNPRTMTIHVGTKVTWTNNESSAIPHTVTSGSPGAASGTFDSPTLNPGQTFQFTFSGVGTFAYFCRIHGAAMTGTMNVVP